jgi:drug/metabolite transporter (DMT)-like permease
MRFHIWHLMAAVAAVAGILWMIRQELPQAVLVLGLCMAVLMIVPLAISEAVHAILEKRNRRKRGPRD